MTYEEFELPFRRLSQAFGLSFSKERAQVYYDRINRLDVNRWTRMVSHWTDTANTFPKLSDLLKMREFKGVDEQPAIDGTTEWLTKDCVAMECVEGLIPVGQHRDDYYPLFSPDTAPGMLFSREVTFRCPRCRRGDENYPRMPVWKGDLTIRTQEEMSRRLRERHEIHLAGGRSEIESMLGGE